MSPHLCRAHAPSSAAAPPAAAATASASACASPQQSERMKRIAEERRKQQAQLEHDLKEKERVRLQIEADRRDVATRRAQASVSRCLVLVLLLHVFFKKRKNKKTDLNLLCWLPPISTACQSITVWRPHQYFQGTRSTVYPFSFDASPSLPLSPHLSLYFSYSLSPLSQFLYFSISFFLSPPSGCGD